MNFAFLLAVLLAMHDIIYAILISLVEKEKGSGRSDRD